MIKAYGWSVDRVRKGLPGNQGWVYYNWAVENEMTVWGTGVERKTPGYVKQEVRKILKEKQDGRNKS